jgi:hypothetical protein
LHREQFEVYKEDLYKRMYHPRFYVKFASAQDEELEGLL